MKIVSGDSVSFSNPVVTVGSFDGVHIGHREIISKLTQRAAEIGGESVVVTFSPHPRVALSNDDENLFFLNSPKERAYLLEQLGVDYLVELNFDKAMATVSMEEFFVEYIGNYLQAKELIMGYNHRFGTPNNFDYDKLNELADSMDIKLTRIEKYGIDERDISSTTIRNLIRRGGLDVANRYLGSPYIFIGEISEDGKLIYNEFKKLLPKDGKYKVLITSEGSTIESVANILQGEICFTGTILAAKGVIIELVEELRD